MTYVLGPSHPNANSRQTGLFAPHGRDSPFAAFVACTRSTCCRRRAAVRRPLADRPTKPDSAPLDSSAFQSATANSSRALICKRAVGRIHRLAARRIVGRRAQLRVHDDRKRRAERGQEDERHERDDERHWRFRFLGDTSIADFEVGERMLPTNDACRPQSHNTARTRRYRPEIGIEPIRGHRIRNPRPVGKSVRSRWAVRWRRSIRSEDRRPDRREAVRLRRRRTSSSAARRLHPRAAHR